MAESQWTDNELSAIKAKVGGKFTTAGFACNRGLTAEQVIIAREIAGGETLADAQFIAAKTTLVELEATVLVGDIEKGMEIWRELEAAAADSDTGNDVSDADDASQGDATDEVAEPNDSDVDGDDDVSDDTGDTEDPPAIQADETEVLLISREADLAKHGEVAQWRAHQLADQLNSICERAGNPRRFTWQEVCVLNKICAPHGSLLRTVTDVDKAWGDNGLPDGPNTLVTKSKVVKVLKANGTDIKQMEDELPAEDDADDSDSTPAADPVLLGEVGPFPTSNELTKKFLLDDPTVAYGEDDRDKMDALFKEVKDLPDIGAQARLIDLIVETGEQEGWRGADKNPRRFMYVRLVRWALMLKPGFKAFRGNNPQVENGKDPVNGILLFIAFYLVDGVISSSDFERFDFGTIEEVRSWINQRRPVSAMPRVVVQRLEGKAPAVGDTIRPAGQGSVASADAEPSLTDDVPPPNQGDDITSNEQPAANSGATVEPVEAATPLPADDTPEPIEAATSPGDGSTDGDDAVSEPAEPHVPVASDDVTSTPSESVAIEAPDEPETDVEQPVEAATPLPADDDQPEPDIIVVITPPPNSGSNGGDADDQVLEPSPAGDDDDSLDDLFAQIAAMTTEFAQKATAAEQAAARAKAKANAA